MSTTVRPLRVACLEKTALTTALIFLWWFDDGRTSLNPERQLAAPNLQQSLIEI